MLGTARAAMNGSSKQYSPALTAQTEPTQQINGDVAEMTMSQKMTEKLPRLELVKFSRRRCEWQPFWELFEQVVDKTDQLSTTDQFHYRRASLMGDAAAVVAVYFQHPGATTMRNSMPYDGLLSCAIMQIRREKETSRAFLS